MRRLAVLALVASLAVVPGCRPKTHERAKVAVSIFPVYDLVRRIAGPDADVTLVLPPGASPHGWTPTAEASEQVARAKLVVSVGLGLDPWMDSLQAAGAPKARILKLGDRVPTITGEGDAIDGHVWMDPQRARLMATAIAEDLSRTDSSHAIAFRDRASAVDASLAALDHEIEARTVKWSSRAFVSFHPSMGYYAERYGLRVVGVIERTPGEPPSAAEREALLATIASQRVRGLFREPQLPSVAAESLAGDAHVPLTTLDPLGAGAGSASGTYEGLIRADTVALESVLR